MTPEFDPQDDDEISVSSVDSEDLDSAATTVPGGDVIYLPKSDLPEDVMRGLAERFPEKPPKLVPPMPAWLGEMLSGWDMRRHEVIAFLFCFEILYLFYYIQISIIGMELL